VTFTLLPAVDVADGQAVRLVRGEANNKTIYGSPLDAAFAFQAQGAEWIHLVDIDAAFGRGSNSALLACVVDALDVYVQLAGGIRDDASLHRALSTGCTQVVLATTALNDLAWCARSIAAHGNRITVGLDVRITLDANGEVHHRLYPRGGNGDSGDLWENIASLDGEGCKRLW
jgi:phosphoribosylanthranilate isomerase